MHRTRTLRGPLPGAANAIPGVRPCKGGVHPEIFPSSPATRVPTVLYGRNTPGVLLPAPRGVILTPGFGVPTPDGSVPQRDGEEFTPGVFCSRGSGTLPAPGVCGWRRLRVHYPACLRAVAGAVREERPEDRVWMLEALAEARRAGEIGEVPIGAVVVRDGEAIGRGHNRREIDGDPLAHAEILAIRQAAERTAGWRLVGAHDVRHPRAVRDVRRSPGQQPFSRLVYGAPDPKAGWCGTLGNLVQDPRLNHRLDDDGRGARSGERRAAARLLRVAAAQAVSGPVLCRFLRRDVRVA